jgi:acyl-CoA synthetase (AMP-forming)/AMP-acid ligase II
MTAVRLLVFGGEALYPSDLRSWQAHTGNTARFINMYGITETTVHVTYKEITEEETDFEHRSVIGRPLDHLDMLAVDRYGRLCPNGIPGELLVTGRGLAQGYLGRPDLTAERFISIMSSAGAVSAYRTGDKGYCLPLGDFIYTGRIDHQVQLRGYRIELGEIEAAFAACPQTAASVVRLITPKDKEPFLAAWVSGAGALNLPDIRKALLTRLPAYMLPAVIICLDALPMNQNGKPDVDKLQELLAQSAASRAEIGGDDGDAIQGIGVESTIIRIWEEVLGTGRINSADRFLEVGGTSMHIMQVHARIQEELGLDDVSLVDLFEHATPRDLAQHLESRTKTAVTS